MGITTFNRANLHPQERVILEQLDELQGYQLNHFNQLESLTPGFELNTNNQITGIGLSFFSFIPDSLGSLLQKLPALNRLFIYTGLVAEFDLTFITNLTGLQELGLAGFFEADLSPLNNLVNLKQLSIEYGSSITTPITLPQLQELTLDYCNISDLNFIAGLTTLKCLSFNDCPIKDLNPVSHLTALEYLSIDGTKVADLTPISHLTALEYLSLSRTKVTDITPISNLLELQELHMHSNKITNLAPIQKIRKLNYLDVRSTTVNDLTPVSNCTALCNLLASHTHIPDLFALKALPALQELDICNTHINDLTPLSGITTLKNLRIAETKIKDLTPLSTLENLEDLYIRKTPVTNLKPLSALKNLQSLQIVGTLVTDLSPLSSLKKLAGLFIHETRITNLSPLANLTALQRLWLCDTPVTDLSPLSSCSMLQELDLREAPVSNLSPLATITTLQKLDLSYTQITDLSPISTFTALTELDLSHTRISDISAIINLTLLKKLDCRYTKITWFDEQLIAGLTQLTELDLYGVNLTNVPKAITDSHECLSHLKNYFKDCSRGQVFIYEAKNILIGNGRVGKTSLVKRWLDNLFNLNEPSTHAIQLRTWLLNELARQEQLEKIQLNIWDFGGQDIYHATHRAFMNTEAIFLLVWDAVTEKTPVQEETLLNGKTARYKNYPIEYWLSYIKVLSNNSPVILVQTHRNRDKQQHIKLTEAQQNEYNVKAILAVESSAAAANGYESLKERIQEIVVEQLKETCTRLPASWYNIRMQISKLQEEQEVKQIPLHDFEAMCTAEQLDSSSKDTLLQYFHNTGVFFYKKGLFNDQIVIDQKWAIDAVYTLFDRNGYFVRTHHNGRFTGEDLQNIWQQHSYNEKELFLSFMLECEICFEKNRDYDRSISFEEREFIAPQLLPENKPLSVTALCRHGNGMYYKYRHAFLHSAIIQRFIVRTGNMAQENDMWQSGIVLNTNEGMALIEAFPENNEIVIRLDEESPKTLLDKIRNEMSYINANEVGVEELISLDGVSFVNLDHLKKNPAGNELIQAENGNWVSADKLRIFLELPKEEVFEKPVPITMPGKKQKAPKKNRTSIPQQNKIRAELQKEIDNLCPFCPNEDVGHFEIHHIDEDPGNNTTSNLLLVCPTCHSKISKGDIKKEAVAKRKKQLNVN